MVKTMYPACQEPSQPESRPASFSVLLLVVIIHTLLVLVSTGGTLVNWAFYRKAYDGPCAIDISITILAVSYLVFGFLGSRTRNRSQIYASLASLALTSILAVFYHFDPPVDVNQVYLQIRIYTCFFGSVIILLIAFWASKDFQETKIVGAGDSLRLMYQQRKHFLTVLILDLIFAIVFAIMAITLDKGIWYALAIVAFAFIRWLIGRTAVVQESKLLIHIFVSIQMLGQLWIPLQILLSTCILKCTVQPVSPLAMLSSAIATLAASLMTHVQLLKVHRNFGYGLTDPGEYMYHGDSM